MINIDETLFLDNFEDFSDVILPIVNSERAEKGLPPLTEQEAMDRYLDLLNEHGHKPVPTKDDKVPGNDPAATSRD